MPKSFFTELEQTQIVDAIKEAELNTSGEIRFHIEALCSVDPYVRAREVFEELGMQNTELKNAVLFYMAYQDKKLAILGDSGIHAKVSQQFWVEEKELMISYFKENKFCEGLCKAIIQAGDKLKTFFPYQTNDVNELSNDISFGKDSDA